MNLTQGIVYYIFSFVLTVAFILCGCFLGAALRKNKDAKDAAANTASVENADEKTE